MTRNLSYNWSTVLRKLAEYGDDGVNQKSFVTLMGGSKHSYNNIAQGVLDQMFFTGSGYVEEFGDVGNVTIRITPEGRKALVAGDK